MGTTIGPDITVPSDNPKTSTPYDSSLIDHADLYMWIIMGVTWLFGFAVIGCIFFTVRAKKRKKQSVYKGLPGNKERNEEGKEKGNEEGNENLKQTSDRDNSVDGNDFVENELYTSTENLDLVNEVQINTTYTKVSYFKQHQTSICGELHLRFQNSTDTVLQDINTGEANTLIEEESYTNGPCMSKAYKIDINEHGNYYQVVPDTEEYVDNCLYQDQAKIILENKTHNPESEEKDRVAPDLCVHPDNTLPIPETLTSNFEEEEEFVDNCLYGNPAEIILESRKHLQETEGNDRFPPNQCDNRDRAASTSQKHTSYFQKEQFEDDDIYEDPSEMILDSELELKEKNHPAPYQYARPDKTQSIPKRYTSHCEEEEEIENCLYGDSTEMIAENRKHLKESEEKNHPDQDQYAQPHKIQSIPKENTSQFEGDDNEDPTEMILNTKENLKLKEKNHPAPYQYARPDKTQSIPKRYTSHFEEEEEIENCLYGDSTEMIAESRKHLKESEQNNHPDQDQYAQPHKVQSIPKENTSQFEEDDYEDPSEMILDSEELELKEKNHPAPYQYARLDKTQSIPKRYRSHFEEEEEIENCLYGDSIEMIAENRKHLKESEQKNHPDQDQYAQPHKVQSIPKENTSQFEEDDYEDPTEMILDSKDHFIESRKKDSAATNTCAYSPKTQSTHQERRSYFRSEQFEDNSIYNDPSDFELESTYHSKESKQKDLVTQLSIRFLDNNPAPHKEYRSNQDQEGFIDNYLYNSLEEIILESDKYSESKKESPNPNFQSNNTQILTDRCKANREEEFEDNVLYDSFGNIMHETEANGPDSMGKDCVISNTNNYPVDPPSNQECMSHIDGEEFAENCLYDNPEDILESEKHSKKIEWVTQHSRIYFDDTLSTDEGNTLAHVGCTSNLDQEEFVNNCLYDSEEEIISKDEKHSFKSEEECVTSIPYMDANNTTFITNECRSYSDEEHGDNHFYDDPYEISSEKH